MIGVLWNGLALGGRSLRCGPRRTLRGIDKQVTKAEKAVAGKVPVKRNRFIRLDGAAKSVNRDLEAKARELAGIKGYHTSLQAQRGNSTRTRNARLTGIRAVLAYALPDHPEHAETITRVLAIPTRRSPAPVLQFLTAEETDALLGAPDTGTWTGRRDHALLTLAVQTGLRITELISLTTGDIYLSAGPHVPCLGKGRRHRATPLMPTTVAVLTGYLTERLTRRGTALFPGPAGQHLSRDALEHRLARHLALAAGTCPSLAAKHITMHSLRHSAAMNLLAAGVDIAVIALWLGHQHTASSDAYLHADMAIKQAAIDRTRPPDTAPGTYRPEPDILTWLSSL